nr:serine hydrolase [Burkholderia ubonensis]
MNRAIKTVIASNAIPGIAVGIIAGGKHYVFNYGLASIETGKPVTPNTGCRRFAGN